MIIFINGASCSGKTSLARALQATWQGPLLRWSLDDVISQLPFSYTGEGTNAAEGFAQLNTPAGAEITAGTHGQQLNILSAQYVKVLSDAGFDVAVDFVALDADLLAPYEDALRDVPLLFVGLRCNEDALQQRNASRDDRASGLAVLQQRRVHFCADRYDVLLDSSQDSSAALTTQLLQHVTDYPPTPGFKP